MPTFAGITVHQVTYTYIQAIVHKVRLQILIDLNFTVNPEIQLKEHNEYYQKLSQSKSETEIEYQNSLRRN